MKPFPLNATELAYRDGYRNGFNQGCLDSIGQTLPPQTVSARENESWKQYDKGIPKIDIFKIAQEALEHARQHPDKRTKAYKQWKAAQTANAQP